MNDGERENEESQPRSRRDRDAQSAVWTGDFGREYTDRNTFDPGVLDELCRKNYGVSRRADQRELLCRASRRQRVSWKWDAIPETSCCFCERWDTRICRASSSSHMRWKSRGGAFRVRRSTGFGAGLAPSATAAFEVVFTSGVLIHICARGSSARDGRDPPLRRNPISGDSNIIPPKSPRCAIAVTTVFCGRWISRGNISSDLQIWSWSGKRICHIVENANVDAAFLLRKKQ